VNTEFELLHKLKVKHSLNLIGDDCAVLPKDAVTDLVITADLLIQDIDFRLEWTAPELLGHKVLAVSLSDIAAMGGTPIWALMSIGVPPVLWENGFVERLFDGWHRLAAKYGVELVGGDMSRSDNVVVDSIAAGHVPKGGAIRRSGATAGDGIFIAGTIGAAAAGLSLLESGKRLAGATCSEEPLLIKQLQPTPQVDIAKSLQSHGVASAMIDISDGLSSDLRHLCRTSLVGATLRSDALPIDGDLRALFPPDQALELALHGGEDFALLFTGDAKKILDLDLPGVSLIGEVTSTVETIRLIQSGGDTILEPKGYRHF
jgi:thiamine-monophosphate kinase